MIEESFYLSEDGALERVCDRTGLSSDEVESMVKRFRSYSKRAGKLRGEFVKYIDGKMVIRSHWEKRRIFWRGIDERANGNEDVDYLER